VTASTGPQTVSCETCQRAFISRRYDGKLARFCCWACFTAAPRRALGTGSSGYWATHKRARRARGAAKSYPCEHCGARARDWALRHGLTGGDPDDFTPLCRRCHVAYDGWHSPPHHTGEANPAAKLTWEQVREIRALRGQVPTIELAAAHGVSQMAIQRIMNGKTWIEQP
jgi:hypothetical protein